LDLPLKKALDGIGSKKDRIEQRDFAYHRRVKNGYLALAQGSPARIKIIKVEDRKEDTQAAIRKCVAAFFNRKRYRI
jgi:dTMP kinase